MGLPKVPNRGFGPLKDQTAEMILILSSFNTERLIFQKKKWNCGKVGKSVSQIEN